MVNNLSPKGPCRLSTLGTYGLAGLAGILFLLFRAGAAYSQVTDDTTRLIYGPSTVRLLSQTAFLGYRPEAMRPDTSLTYLDRTNEFLFIDGEPQKNGGYIGAQQQSLFFRLPPQIGLSMGRDAFEYLYYNPLREPLIRTYSLYSQIRYNQGSYGRQWAEATLSKNWSPNVNGTIIYRRMTAQRMINVTRLRQRGLEHNAFLARLNGNSPDGRYRAVASLSSLSQFVLETGGVAPEPGDTPDSLFRFEVSPARLPVGTRTYERRMGWHFDQSYALDSTGRFYLYQRARYYRQTNRYTDPAGTPPVTRFYFEEANTNEEFEFDAGEVEGGMGTYIRGVRLRAGAMYRRVGYTGSYGTFAGPRRELHLVSNGGVRVRQLGDLDLTAHWVAGRDYRFAGLLDTRYGAVSAVVQRTAVPFTLQNLISNQFIWSLPDAFMQGQSVRLEPRVKVGRQELAPYIEVTRVADAWVLREPIVEPTRVPSASFLYLGARYRFSSGPWVTDGHGQYTLAGEELHPAPRIWADTRFYYRRSLAQNRYELMGGINYRFRTAFNGHKYEPITGQFVLQNLALVGAEGALQEGYLQANSYGLVNLFVNVRVNRTRAYLMLGNALQGVGGLGYFDFPFYPGARRNFEFGINWMFFD